MQDVSLGSYHIPTYVFILFHKLEMFVLVLRMGAYCHLPI